MTLGLSDATEVAAGAGVVFGAAVVAGVAAAGAGLAAAVGAAAVAGAAAGAVVLGEVEEAEAGLAEALAGAGVAAAVFVDEAAGAAEGVLVSTAADKRAGHTMADTANTRRALVFRVYGIFMFVVINPRSGGEHISSLDDALAFYLRAKVIMR